MAAALTACQSAPKDDPSSRGPTLSVDPAQVQPPPGVAAEFIEPRTDDDWRRAQLPLEEILAGLPRPAYLPAATTPALTTQPATAPATSPSSPSSAPPADPGLDDIPLAAQHAYVAGRQAWRDRQNLEAIRQLNIALAQAPNSPQILRLLGDIYIASGNRVRGALYLQQALAQNPDDIDSLAMLGRGEFEQGDLDKAIVVFADALSRAGADADAALTMVMRHYLASALEGRDYDAAAVAQYESYLPELGSFGHRTRYIRELVLIHRQQSQTWQSVGDAHNRLGQAALALLAYRQSLATAQERDTRDDLSPRLVYTLLKLDRYDMAREIVIQDVRQNVASAASLKLVDYLAKLGAARQLAGQLQPIYHEVGEPADLVIRIAGLSDPAAALEQLHAHLRKHPADRAVFEHLVKQAFAGTLGQAAQSIRVAVELIKAVPAATDDYAAILIASAPGPDAVLTTIGHLGKQEQAAGQVLYLKGRTWAAAGRFDEAAQAYAAAIHADPLLDAARLAMARHLLDTRQYDQAVHVLQPLDDGDKAVAMRIELLRARGHGDQALALLDQQLTRQPGNVELLRLKAELLLATGQPGDAAEAERLLREAVTAQPHSEPLYEILFAIYHNAATPESERRRLTLLRQAMQSIPGARITRLQLAQERIRGGELPQAQHDLQALLKENPGDIDALGLMLVALIHDNKADEARVMLEAALETATVDRQLLAVAQAFYRSIGDMPAFYRVTERLAMTEPPGPRRAMTLAAVYLETKQPDKALAQLVPLVGTDLAEPAQVMGMLGRALIATGKVAELDRHFEAAVQRYQDHGAALYYEWAMAYSQLDQTQRAEALLEQALLKDANHPQANNALAYTWADRGLNLDEAQKKAQIALAAEPRNPAYLDTMGWIDYKRGRWDGAVGQLALARLQPGGDHPVILAHLGDALYRLGRHDEALQYWRVANEFAGDEQAANDPEVAHLRPGLKARIEAVNKGQEPPLAPAAPTSAAQP
ncbi:MAG: tetratricopeptide repeat protein [Phycisphaeraceae bacterium]